MAAIIERTVADEVAAAVAALDEVTRFAADARAHLTAGSDPGHLEGARRAAGIATCSAGAAVRAVRAALAQRLDELV